MGSDEGGLAVYSERRVESLADVPGVENEGVPERVLVADDMAE